MVFTNEDIRQATGLTQSRLHRAQQRGLLKPQKPGRKGQGGAPEWSLANLGSAFLYAEWTSVGFAPELLKLLLPQFEAMEGWKTNPRRLANGKLSFNLSDFPVHIMFSRKFAVESDDGSEELADPWKVRHALRAWVPVTIGSIALFVGVRDAPVYERFAEFVRIGLLHESHAEVAWGLLFEARTETGTDDLDEPVTLADVRAEGDTKSWTERLLNFLGVAPGSATASNIFREIKKGAVEHQLLAAWEPSLASMKRAKAEED